MDSIYTYLAIIVATADPYVTTLRIWTRFYASTNNFPENNTFCEAKE